MEYVLKGPVVTEKSMNLVSVENKYSFVVDRYASKGQIKEAVESLFKVKVLGVEVLKNRGRLKRSMVGKRSEYRSKDTKKAIVELAEKDTIKLFEKVKA